MENLLDMYGDSVYRFCRSLTYSKEDAEDLFQETFLKAFEQYAKIRAVDNPQRYLFSTAAWLWKSWKRKFARRQRIASEGGPLSENTADNADTEDGLLAQDENRLVKELVDALPDKYKIPIVLYYTSEMSVQEIARTLGLPEGTVKSRLFKARKLVGKGLDKVNHE